MENILSISLFVIAICLLFISVYDVYKNRYVTKRQRTNFLFIIFALPVAGSLIYYFLKVFLVNTTKGN